MEALLSARTYAAGETIMRGGDPADEVFLLVAGEVSVRAVPTACGCRRCRPAWLSASSRDEGGAPADVVADARVELAVLDSEDFHALGA